MECDLIAALQAYGTNGRTRGCGQCRRSTARSSVDDIVLDGDDTGTAGGHPDNTRGAYSTATCGPSFPGGPPSATPTNATPPVPPGACFRCRMFGHWSKDYATTAPIQHQVTTQMLEAQTAQTRAAVVP